MKHFLAQIEQPMQRAGSVWGMPLASSVIARYGQRAQLPQETHNSGLASEIFFMGVKAMKSVVGCGRVIPMSSSIEWMPRSCMRKDVPDSRSLMMP